MRRMQEHRLSPSPVAHFVSSHEKLIRQFYWSFMECAHSASRSLPMAFRYTQYCCDNDVNVIAHLTGDTKALSVTRVLAESMNSPRFTVLHI